MDKGVMEDAITCSICSEEYKTGVRDPLILPCGHTFCRGCIDSVKKTKNIACPTCRERYDETKIDNLAMNYSILSLSENITHFKPQTCTTHGKLLDLWCSHCRVIVCGLCVVQDHRQEIHEIKSAHDQLSAMKLSIKNQQGTLNEILSFRKAGILHQTRNVILALLETLKDHRQLQTQTLLIAKMSEEAYAATNIESLEVYHAKLNSLQSSITSALQNDTNQEHGDEVEKTTTATSNTNVNNKGGKTLSMPGVAVRDFPYPLSVCVIDNAKRSAILSWEDNKCLLSAFQVEPVKCHITLQWTTLSVLLSENTPNAFMDLAIGEKYLGRVYFQVWGHLRRTQHFLVLCLGLLGPCYKGGIFRSAHKDEFKERICGCLYKNLDGTLGTKGIMENLEWDGEYAGKSYEGLVVGTSGGRTDMDGLFSIYTKVKNKATCFCPFGEVVAGLDIVKRALEHEPVSEVVVRRSGIVIPTSFFK